MTNGRMPSVRRAEFLSNEVVVRLWRPAPLDIPHYLWVATRKSPPVTSFGDSDLDDTLARLGPRPFSIVRVFAPRSTVEAAIRRSGSPDGGARALRDSGSAARYETDEERLGFSRTYRITFDRPVDVLGICRGLAALDVVESARPNYLRYGARRPDDPLYAEQWGLGVINAEAGWDVETGHPDVMIAIVDSGVRADHEDLAPKLMNGYDFVDYTDDPGPKYQLLGDYQQRDDDPADDMGHGTEVAGVAAANTNSCKGIAGMCWGGRILPVRVLFRRRPLSTHVSEAVGTETDIDAGIKFAVDAGAHVVNLSLAGSEPGDPSVLQYARERQVCVVAATGNDGADIPMYPAADPTVLAVGAVNHQLARSECSNYGSSYGKFVMAPGVDIKTTTYAESPYEYASGTSVAAPFVSGLAALIVSLGMRRSNRPKVEAVLAIIRETAKPGDGTTKDDPETGEGLIDAGAALLRAAEEL